MATYKIVLRFDTADGESWQEIVKVKAATLNDADNIASRMQVERDADAVWVQA